jgi:hypothetical protein
MTPLDDVRVRRVDKFAFLYLIWVWHGMAQNYQPPKMFGLFPKMIKFVVPLAHIGTPSFEPNH